MITCTLNNKKYTVDFITGRALREMEPAAKMYGRIVALSNAAIKGEVPEDAKNLSVIEALDVMILWFCVLFQNQFTSDDVLDNYPVDRLMHDIALALMAVQAQMTDVVFYSTYNALMESGWRFDDIDRMDMLGFLRVRARDARRKPKRKHLAERISTRCGRT